MKRTTNEQRCFFYTIAAIICVIGIISILVHVNNSMVVVGKFIAYELVFFVIMLALVVYELINTFRFFKTKESN